MQKLMALLFSCAFLATANAADPDPLFRSSQPLDIKLTAAFSVIDRERDKEQKYDGTLSYVDDSGAEISFEVGLEVRGNWRLQHSNCRYAQLWLDLKNDQTPGTLFENQNRLKLVVQCGPQDRFQQYVAKERQAYQIFEELSDYNFDTRLLNVSYIDKDEPSGDRTHLAFVIEHQNRVSDRFEMSEVELNSIPAADLDARQSGLVAIFMYLIGNTDYSLIQGPENDECCHNSKLLTVGNGRYFPIPYDFDASGFADVAYAPEPNPEFNLTSNRDRLYRGFCIPESTLAEVIAQFTLKRDQITSIVSDTTYISQRNADSNLRFVNNFYEVLGDARRLQREIVNQCR